MTHGGEDGIRGSAVSAPGGPGDPGQAAAFRAAIRVRPGARRTEVGGSAPGAGPTGPREPRPALAVSVTQRAVDGAATAAAERALAKALGVPAGRVRVVRGFSSRDKTVEIDPAGPEVIRAWDRLLRGR